MARFKDLPPELTGLVVHYCSDDLLNPSRNLRRYPPESRKETLREFLLLRLTCHAINRAIEDLLSRAEELKLWSVESRFLPEAKIMLLYAVKRDSNKRYPFIAAIQEAGKIIQRTRGVAEDGTNQHQDAQEEIWRSICSAFVEGSIMHREMSQDRRTPTTDDIVIITAAYDGDISLLRATLSRCPRALDADNWDMLEHPILTASLRGHCRVSKTIIQNSSNLDLGDLTDENYNNPLHLAAASGNFELFTWYLHDHDLNLRGFTDGYRTPAGMAASRGHRKIVEYICSEHTEAKKSDFDERFDGDIRYRKNGGRVNAEVKDMIYSAAGAGQISILEYLFYKQGYTVSGLYDYSRRPTSPVFGAVAAGHLDVVKVLMSDRAMPDKHFRHKSAWWGLLAAAKAGRIEMLDYFLTFESVLERLRLTGRRDPVLALMLENGQMDLFERVVGYQVFDRGDERARALHAAICYRRKDAMMMLVNRGDVDINWRDPYGRTALSIAKVNFLEVVEFLVQSA